MAATAELGILLKARDEASSVLGNVAKAGAALGFAFVTFAATAVKAAADEEVGMKQLAKAVDNTGRSWNELRGEGVTLGNQIEANIKSLAAMSGVADDEMRPALALLIAQTGDLDTAMDRLPLALDLARGGNIDLAQASKLLGKLTEDNVNVFKRMGLTFSKDATELDVLAAVQAKFGGQAEEFGKTAAGQMAALQHELSDVVEEIGFALLPMFKEAMKIVRGFISSFSEGGGLAGVKDAFGKVFTIVSELLGVLTGSAPDAGAALKDAIGPEAASAIMGAVAGIRDVIQAVVGTLQQFVTWLNSSDEAAGVVRGVLKFLADLIGTVLHAVLIIITASFHELANTVRNLGPAFHTLGQIVQAIRDAFAEFALFILTLWRNIVLGITGAINNVIGVINGFITKYNEIAEKLGLPILGTISLITPNLDAVNDAIDQVARSRSANINVSTNFLPPSMNVHPQAAGGDYLVTSPTLFVAGDAGAERATFTPIRGGGGTGGGGGGAGTIHIEVHGSVIGITDLEARVRQVVREGNQGGGFHGTLR